jgi:arylsulfatase A-like enzyme
MRGTVHLSHAAPTLWLAAIACAMWPAAQLAEQSRATAKSLVIVTLDTARAPLTLSAHTSLFSGLNPPQHRVRDNADPPLNPAEVTLAQVLRSCGRQTAAFVGSAALAADRGLASGFDVYDDGRVAGTHPPAYRPGQVVVDRALEWLSRSDDEPFFLWVHLAYAPADVQLARMLQALDDRGVSGDTVVMVAGDRGELLGDAGALRVPLTIRAPRLSAQRLDFVANLIDLPVTALDLLQLPPALGDGHSFAPAIRGARR